MADNAREADESVLGRLWEVAHKYQRQLARGEVGPLREAEADRRKVAPLARKLRTTAERALDGIAYRSLAEMQLRRDSRRRLSNVPPLLRLRRLGFELAVRARPVVFLSGPAALEPRGLLASVSFGTRGDERENPLAELAAELDESDHRVAFRDLDDAALERLRGELKRRVVGRRFRPAELASALSPEEADLLSQLARRGEVTVLTDRAGNVEIAEGRSTAGTAIAMAIRPRQGT